EARRDSTVGDLRPPRLSRAGPGMAPGRRPSPAPVRSRPRPLARRPLVGRQRPHPSAFGLALRARDPAGRLERVPADDQRAAGAPPRLLPPGPALLVAALGSDH